MNTKHRLIMFLVAGSLAASACSGTAATTSTTTGAPATTTAVAEHPTTTTAATEAPDAPSADVDQSVATMVSNLADGYKTVLDAWPGFDPRDHPAVVACKDAAGELTNVIAINHPSPEALGDASAVAAPASLGTVHQIKNPTDAAKLKDMVSFEFDVKLGGESSFAINAGGADSFFDHTTLDYVSTFLHEMFHRYQMFNFNEPNTGQDVEGYAYTAENLELAVLEERALKAALTAETDEARDAAARHFAALRIARLDADRRVMLDTGQEIAEGTARYLEHKLAGDNSGYHYRNDNFHTDLLTTLQGGVKDGFGFGRFYASGAAGIELLDRMGVADAKSRIQNGEGPAKVLAESLGVSAEQVRSLVADAKTAYDPLAELPAKAEEAAERAESEPPVFGEGPGGDEGVDIELTEEQMDCLNERMGDAEDGAVISDEIWEACVGS